MRPVDILKPAAWRYWDGTRWGKNPAKVQKLISAVGGVSQTFSVLRRGDRWYAVSKQNEFLGRDLVIRNAPGPTGPFTVSPSSATIPSNTATGMLRYMPLAHPDLLPQEGSIVVSFSQNNTDLGEIGRNPFLYRPYFLRVDLP